MPFFDYSLLLRGPYHEMLLGGLWLSLQLLCASLVLALPIALGVALLRLSPSPPLRWFAATYVEVIRNVPLLAHMLVWYFGAPELLPDGLKQWLYARNIEAFSAVIALALYAGAYMAEDIRSGIRAIPTVQLEAGRALGFGFLASMRRIVLPQALRVTVPPLISQTLNLWKNTSIATVIGGLSAMMGIGGGSLGGMTMTLCGRPIHQAVATASGFGFAIGLAATLGFVVFGWDAPGRPPLSLGYVNLPAAAILGVVTTLAAPWGARLAHRLDRRVLKRIFAAYMIVTALSVVVKAL